MSEKEKQESVTAWEAFAVRCVAAAVAIKKAQGQVVSVWSPVASKFQSVKPVPAMAAA